MDRLSHLLPDPDIYDIIQSVLSESTATTRKLFITLLRFGEIPPTESKLYAKIYPALEALFSSPRLHRKGGLLGTIRGEEREPEFSALPSMHLNSILNSPVYRGIAIQCTFLHPIPIEEVEATKEAAVMKELTAMQSTPYLPSYLNFRPFFVKGAQHEQILPQIPSNPDAAFHVYSVFDSWREKMRGKVLFPHMSNKVIPRQAMEALSHFSFLTEEPGQQTQGSLERVQAFTGIQIGGDSQMGSRWYVNGLGPRVFYCAGASAYWSSRYMKEPFNDLVERLPVCNKHDRVNPTRIFVGDDDCLFYDLTSFSSLMSTQVPFLDDLAAFCRGVPVYTVDLVKGYQVEDLGELIQAYNQTNKQGGYTSTIVPGCHDYRDVHGVAGFLGITGNMATCNFLHGALLYQLSDGSKRCGCAGDDGAIVYKHDADLSKEKILEAISELGVLQHDKVYDTADYNTCIYLKRMIRVGHYGFLERNDYVNPPSFLYMLGKGFKDDPRFREAGSSKAELLKLSADSLQSTFRGAAYLNPDDLDTLKAFLMNYYDAHHFDRAGRIPAVDGDGLSYPSIEFVGRAEYMALTALSRYQGEARLPDRSEDPEGEFVHDVRIEAGGRFYAKSSPMLKYLVRTGFGEMIEKRKVVYYGVEGYEKLGEEMSKEVRKRPAWRLYELSWDLGFLGIEGGGVRGFYPATG